MVKQILVYGSLRQGFQNHRILERGGAEFIEKTRLPGFDLYGVGWYPGIRPNRDNKEGVVGELYKLPEGGDLMDNLDLYEGYVKDNHPGSLFIREEVTVNGEPTYVYVYNGKVGDGYAGKVPSGDWEDSKR